MDEDGVEEGQAQQLQRDAVCRLLRRQGRVLVAGQRRKQPTDEDGLRGGVSIAIGITLCDEDGGSEHESPPLAPPSLVAG